MEKLLLLFIIGLSFQGNSQTNYTVTANGNTWSDNSLTINAGDSITFINPNHGSHNINGTTESFPYNPESFGMTRESENWIYGYRFNVPGTYSFRCDLHPSMMAGYIVVQELAGINEENPDYLVYPNPTENILYLPVSSTERQVNVFDLLGNLVFTKSLFAENQIDLFLLNPGSYLLEVKEGGTSKTQRITKK